MGTENTEILNDFSISVFINEVFQGSGHRGKLPARRVVLTQGLPETSLQVHEIPQLHPRVPQELAHVLAPSLSNIFQRMEVQGFPWQLKENVRAPPYLQKGSRGLHWSVWQENLTHHAQTETREIRLDVRRGKLPWGQSSNEQAAQEALQAPSWEVSSPNQTQPWAAWSGLVWSGGDPALSLSGHAQPELCYVPMLSWVG